MTLRKGKLGMDLRRTTLNSDVQRDPFVRMGWNLCVTALDKGKLEGLSPCLMSMLQAGGPGVLEKKWNPTKACQHFSNFFPSGFFFKYKFSFYSEIVCFFNNPKGFPSLVFYSSPPHPLPSLHSAPISNFATEKRVEGGEGEEGVILDSFKVWGFQVEENQKIFM